MQITKILRNKKIENNIEIDCMHRMLRLRGISEGELIKISKKDTIKKILSR